jgi:putative transposase
MSVWRPHALAYYQTARPHQGLGNVPIQGDSTLPEPFDGCRLDDIVCHETLGGLLKHYERKAA